MSTYIYTRYIGGNHNYNYKFYQICNVLGVNVLLNIYYNRSIRLGCRLLDKLSCQSKN